MTQWIKSSFSVPNGCVEVSFVVPKWIKASASGTSNCVEVAGGGFAVAVRDSDLPGAVLNVPGVNWDAFLEGARAGEFDLPEQRSGGSWVASSFSNADTCVQVSFVESGTVWIRDTGAPGHLVRTSYSDWEIFLKGVRAGEFDRPTA